MKNYVTILLLNFIAFSLSAQNETEPNNSFGQADLIGFGNTIQGKINSSGDVDYYKVDVTEPGVIKLHVSSVPDNISLRGAIFDVSEIEIYYTGSVGTAQGYTLEVSTCNVGFHYIALWDAHNPGHFNNDDSYNLQVDFTPFSLLDGCECEDESFGEACEIEFGETIEAVIAPWFDDSPRQVDVDYYKVDVTEPGIIKLHVSSVPSNISLRASIFDISEVEIKYSGSVGTAQGYTLEVSTCDVGFHYIALWDAHNTGHFNSEDQYNLQIDFTPFSLLDGCECENESFGEACEIEFGETIEAVIAPWFDDSPRQVDVDYYKVDVTEPGMIKLHVSSVPSNISLRASIFDVSEMEIKYSGSVGTAQGYTLEVSTCDVGFHYIALWDAHNTGHFNSEDQYNLQIDFTPFSLLDDCECENGSFGEACEIEFGETTEAVIAPWFDDNPRQVDVDYYKVDVTEPGIIKLHVSSVPSNISLRASIFDISEVEIKYSGDVGTAQGYTFEVSTCDIGFHYIALWDAHNPGHFNSEDSYNLQVDFTPFSLLDDCECENESFGEACLIGACDTIQAVIAPWFGDNSSDKDEDFYVINLEANSEIDITITSVPVSIGLCIEIYDMNETLINNFNESNGQAINVNFTTSEAGSYYIKVTDCGNDFNSEDQYTMYIGCNVIDGVNNLDETQLIQLHPNPASTHFSIQSHFLIQNIQVFDAIGKQIPFKKEGDLKKIETTNWQSGIYFILIQTEAGLVSKKLVKQ